jgi:hypothetical protein
MRAQSWLNEASARVAQSKPPQPVDDKRAITLRRLLLAYPMRRRSARVLRGAFYFFLGFVAIQVGAAMGSALGRPDTIGIPDYFSGGVIYGDLITVFVLMVIAMGCRMWSLRVEESEPTTQTRSRLTSQCVVAVPIQPARGQDRAHRLLLLDSFHNRGRDRNRPGRLRRPAPDSR